MWLSNKLTAIPVSRIIFSCSIMLVTCLATPWSNCRRGGTWVISNKLQCFVRIEWSLITTLPRVCYTGPRIPGPCVANFSSDTRLTLSWPGTRGATQFDVQVRDSVTKERVYNSTVRPSNSTDELLVEVQVEPSEQYAIHITSFGDDNQRGNTVSCNGSRPNTGPTTGTCT